MRVEVGVKERVNKKLARSRLTWAGHLERMRDENLTESRCAESGWEKEAKKTEIAMRVALKET